MLLLAFLNSPPRLLHQRHNGYIYATAHARDVDGRDRLYDGATPVDIDAGFEIAPGDATGIRVVNAYAWGSWSLVFSDGSSALTSKHASRWMGTPRCLQHKTRMFHDHLTAELGMRDRSGNFLVRDGDKVAAQDDQSDVLLRKLDKRR